MSSEFSDSQPNIAPGSIPDPLMEELYFTAEAELLAREAIHCELMARSLRRGMIQRRPPSLPQISWTAGFAATAGFPEIVKNEWQATQYHKQAKEHTYLAMVCDVLGQAYATINKEKPKPCD